MQSNSLVARVSKIMTAAAVSVFFAMPFGSADAADMPVKALPPPLPPPVYSWSGCYLGGQVGGARGAATGFVNYPGDPLRGTGPFAASQDFNGSSFLYGGQIGCNWQPGGGAFVLGLEGDLAGLSDGRSGGQLFRFAAPFATDHFDNTSRYADEASLRLRVGYAMDRMLLTSAGGWSRAWLSASGDFARDGDGSVLFNTGATRDGWNIGVGAEYALATNWTVGVEYRYTDYGSAAMNVPAGTAGTLAWQPFTVGIENLHTSEVRLRLNYLFNLGGPVASRY